MHLFADRLLTLDGGRTLDLASGHIVDCVRVAVARGARGRQWRDQADRRLACWHSHLPVWLDMIPVSAHEVLVVSEPSSAPRTSPAPVIAAAESWLAGQDAGACLAGEPGTAGRRVASGVMDVRAVGVRLVPPAGLDALRALLDGLSDEARCVPVEAPRGAGLTTWLRIVAREARQRGACPVSSRAIARVPAAVPLLSRRTVVLLEDRHGDDEDHDAAETATAAAVRLWRAGARVALVTGAVGRGWSGPRIALSGPPLGALAEAMTTWPATTPARRRSLLQRAAGHPGAFVAQWLGRPGDRAHAWGRQVSSHALVAREPRARWRSTTVARVAGARDRCPGSVAETLRSAGTAAFERARLDAAVPALALAIVVADLHGLAVERVRARCALASVRVWQGQLSAAARLLRGVTPVGGTSSLVAGCRAALLMARGDGTGAWAQWRTAIDDACNPRQAAEAMAAAGLSHWRLGDRHGAAALCRAAARMARASRDRRAWFDVCLLRLACRADDDRAGAGSARARLMRRLLRGDVPLLLRLRVLCLRDGISAAHRPEVAQFVDRWGDHLLKDLGLAGAGTEGDTAMVRDLQAILEICRDTDDSRSAMAQTCTRVRTRLDAAAVSVHGLPADRPRLAHAGPERGDLRPLVARVIETGLAVGPHATPEGLHAATPIRFAGDVRGAVVCRWSVDARVDGHEVDLLLAGAATALAPHVYQLLDTASRDRHATADTLGLLGTSGVVTALRDRIRRVAAAPFHTLIEGESGSGKELVARALHAAGPRHLRRFCAVNCAALTDDLLEAELFGHARGAFTGAVGDRAGLFEEADGGTLFLDEVGELSLRAQAKLLRVIQDGEVRRVGESFPRRVDARIVAATNRTLAEEVAAARFRADLLYRLDVIRILVLPLRDRPDDVVVIARACWQDATGRLGSRAQLHPATLAALARYHWPGNVRELQNVMRALSVNAPQRGFVGPGALPAAIAAAGATPAVTLDAARRSFEERFVRAALARAGHRPTLAARDLGVSRQGLRKLILRLGIAEPLPRLREGVSGAEGA